MEKELALTPHPSLARSPAGPVQIRVQLTKLANVLAELGEEYLREMEIAQVILLVANAVVFFCSIAYFRVLLYNVSLERLNLFQVFLAVPKNVVFKLASKTVKLGEGDDVRRRACS